MQANAQLSLNLFKIPTVSNIFLFIRSRRYEALLFSFMLLIFGNTFANHSHLIGLVDIYQNLLIGLIIFYNKKGMRTILISIILLSVTFNILETCIPAVADVKRWLGLLYLSFFFLVSKEVFKEVLYTKTVSRELLAAALCGFVLLCMIATFLFFIIELNHPNSFSNVGEGKSVLTNINYFSFTTLLTIGFGDTTPLTIVAKRAVMLIGLTGHFYTVFITSIIIGKYLSAKRT